MPNGLKNKAAQVLTDNTYETTLNGKTYKRIIPSREFYVHQWNWDSATHALGLVHMDDCKAYDELHSLISGQWDNGLIAQITFNPNEKKYYPGPEHWGTSKFARGEIATSGITQPPLLGFSISYVYSNMKDKKIADKFLDEMLPALIKYHEYLKNFRDRENSGLLTVTHPWESGLDNSPRWDGVLKRISLSDIPDQIKINVNKFRSDDKVGDPNHRPGMEEYYKYMYLVELYKNWDWDYEKIVSKSPFAVKDILFNSLWYWSNDSMAKLLRKLKNVHAEKFASWADETYKALMKQWDSDLEIFTDINVAQGENIKIKKDTIATFMPLLCGIKDEKILDTLFRKLTDKKVYKSACPVPTTPINSSDFNVSKYWRGPTWPITNLFIIEGLKKYDNNLSRNIAENLVESTLNMIENNGFFEYYDPTSGQARPGKTNTALGFGTFSWTAAVALYLQYNYREALRESE